MTQNTQLRFQLWGWILFILSAIFFMTASIRAQDPVSLIGGTLFLVACFVFLAPLLVQRASNSSPPRKCFQYRPNWFRAASSRSRVPGVLTMPPMPAIISSIT